MESFIVNAAMDTAMNRLPRRLGERANSVSGGSVVVGGQSEACPPLTATIRRDGGHSANAPLPTLRSGRRVAHTAPANCAYFQASFDSGTVRAADSSALALAAVPSRTRPAMPCVMPARRNRL